MMMSRGFRAVDAMSPLSHIEVQFKNALLGEALFEFTSNQSFLGFPKERPF